MGKRVMSFADEQKRRGAFARSEHGVIGVEVERIVGSVGRAHELDLKFRNSRAFRLTRSSETRVRRVRQLFETGVVPPLELYQIGDDYFVLDGHHRVSVAHERGQLFLDANVVEYRPDRNDPANVVYYERAAFVAATGLETVIATEVGRYPRLLSRIQSYHRDLGQEERALAAQTLARLMPIAMIEAPRRQSLREAARIWHADEYRPVIDVLHAEGIPARFAGCSDGDRYGHVSDHRWFLSERRGWDVGLDVALVDFIHRFSDQPTTDSLVDPIVAYGSDVLEHVAGGRLNSFRGLTANSVTALVIGVILLPIAFIRGLRPKDFRIPRPFFGG